jgi:hypothetical protein
LAAAPSANKDAATKEVQDLISPFYIHPNENPSMVLVTHVLSDGNCYTWSTSIRMSLEMNNIDEFLDGSIILVYVDDVVLAGNDLN